MRNTNRKSTGNNKAYREKTEQAIQREKINALRTVIA